MPDQGKFNIIQVVILSAGLGTRLRPYTDNIPKVMMPFLGKPLLEYHIEHFKRHGISDFFVNLHYLPDTITDYFGDGSKWGARIRYGYEPEILGTAGGVKQFESDLDDHFFVAYGDMWSEIDYAKMTEAYFKKDDVACMTVVGENDHPQDSDLVETDDRLKFLKLHPKPHKEPIPAGAKSLDAMYILNKKILRHMPAGEYWEIDHRLLPDALAASDAIYGYETKDFLYDIGTIERYRMVEERLKNKKPN